MGKGRKTQPNNSAGYWCSVSGEGPSMGWKAPIFTTSKEDAIVKMELPINSGAYFYGPFFSRWDCWKRLQECLSSLKGAPS